MATDYTGLTLKARAEARDLVYSNPITRETPTGERDGVNTIFYLQNKNIVSGLIAGVQYGPFLTYGAAKRSLFSGAAPFTLDILNALLTMTTAPDNGTTMPFFCDYNFQWFQDSDYAYWIDQATEELGQVAGSFAPGIPNGGSLEAALVQYVIERYWVNRASLYAQKYASSAAGADEKIQTVTQSYLALAKQARTKAASMREAAYVDPGGRKKAASGTITSIISRYTPRR